MNQIATIQLKNNTLTLPSPLRELWRNRKLTLLMERDRLIVQPLDVEWDQYEEKVKRGKNLISPKLIDEAIRWAKQRN